MQTMGSARIVGFDEMGGVLSGTSSFTASRGRSLRRSLTWYRGHEMAKHKPFTVATNVKVHSLTG
jgi:IS30 family transposase